MKKRNLYISAFLFTLLTHPTHAAMIDANVLPPVAKDAAVTDSSSIFANPSVSYLQYFSQQVNLGSSGTKLNLDMAGRVPLNQQVGLILGFYGGSGPSPSTTQTAALRMLFPADLGVFATFYGRQNNVSDFFFSADLLATTLPDKILDSKSTLLFTPGFLALSAGEFQDIFVGDQSKGSKDPFRFLSIGGRVRLLTALWDQAQVAPLFATTPGRLSSFGADADYSLWVELGLDVADFKIQYYNFLGGDIGALADNGETGFFKSGAIEFTLSKAIDFNTRETEAPIKTLMNDPKNISSESKKEDQPKKGASPKRKKGDQPKKDAPSESQP